MLMGILGWCGAVACSLQRWWRPYDYQIIQEDVKYHGKTEAFEERDRQLEIAAMTVEPPRK